MSRLSPALTFKSETELFEGLQAIRKIPMNIELEIVRDSQVMNLKNGINKVGIPDLIILRQGRRRPKENFCKAFFKLMLNHLNFELLDL